MSGTRDQRATTSEVRAIYRAFSENAITTKSDLAYGPLHAVTWGFKHLDISEPMTAFSYDAASLEGYRDGIISHAKSTLRDILASLDTDVCIAFAACSPSLTRSQGFTGLMKAAAAAKYAESGSELSLVTVLEWYTKMTGAYMLTTKFVSDIEILLNGIQSREPTMISERASVQRVRKAIQDDLTYFKEQGVMLAPAKSWFLALGTALRERDMITEEYEEAKGHCAASRRFDDWAITMPVVCIGVILSKANPE